MVAGGLWLLYPRQALERRLSETADSPLSAAYLHNLLRSDPENPTLRLLLAPANPARRDGQCPRDTRPRTGVEQPGDPP
jgi:hypothetical protein